MKSRTVCTSIGVALSALMACGMAQATASAADPGTYASRAPIVIKKGETEGTASVFCKDGYHATGGGFVSNYRHVSPVLSGPAFKNGEVRGWRAVLTVGDAGPRTSDLDAGYVNVICAKDA
ncbi:hypothetical protein GCM10023347_33210 [Streptomyces chumphonensis]|uniref:Secreted protein n=1 Tax=Streptomyces chumphonensis TaxID=1214925 RepID=A0A927F2G9_9ACTN|nr:hypothetical protein [Streptomyces chumphonensis]MBD3933507.1 hypothetical protein [Streptomyces chumphonensis]